jgi:hypothetical protein
MSFEKSQLEELSRLCTGVEVHAEGSYTFILLRELQFQHGGETLKMNVLICPQSHDGYPTRIFLERKLEANGTANWKVYTFLGQNWHSWSWNNVPQEQRLAQILADHLSPLMS